MSLHEQSVGASDEWYTPPYVFEAMSVAFDLDVASPFDLVPWIPATGWIYDRSLEREWRGFVWCNPPFGGRNGLIPWLDKFVGHANGVCLVPDRTSAPWWQAVVQQMELVLFVSPKIRFIGAAGKEGRSPAQGTCLMSIGTRGGQALRNARNAGLGFLMREV